MALANKYLPVPFTGWTPNPIPTECGSTRRPKDAGAWTLTSPCLHRGKGPPDGLSSGSFPRIRIRFHCDTAWEQFVAGASDHSYLMVPFSNVKSISPKSIYLDANINHEVLSRLLQIFNFGKKEYVLL